MPRVDKALLYRNISDRIRQEREKKSITQTALASMVSVSRASIVNIEKNRQHPPLHLIWEIAIALELNPTVLIPPLEKIIGNSKVRLESQIEREAEGEVERERIKELISKRSKLPETTKPYDPEED